MNKEVSQRVKDVLRHISERISADHSEMLTAEYLLWGLLQDDKVQDILVEEGVDTLSIASDLERLLRDYLNFMTAGPDNGTPVTSEAVKRILTQACSIAKKDHPVDVDDLLHAVYMESDTDASFLLEKYGYADRDERAERAKLNAAAEEAFNFDDEEFESDRESSDKERKSYDLPIALTRFTKDLNAEAMAGKVDPLIGRDEEVEKLILALSRRLKNSALLVGEAGVGKTAIVRGLAHRLANGTAPAMLEGYRIFALDYGAMVAGAKFRGELEERVQGVLNGLEKVDKAILFIDEFHQLTSGPSESSNDAASLFKGALTSGNLRIIGATTYDELKKIEVRDSAFLRRFQRIDVKEPPVEDAIKIISGLQSRFEEFHHAKFEDGAIRSAVELSHRFLSGRRLPDKAIDVIDEAGALHRLHLSTEESSGKDTGIITKEEIENVISKISGIPTKTVTAEDNERLRGLADKLKSYIFGQDDAVQALTDAIVMSRSGLGKVDKPIASFLLAGPTGVGKTELSKKLAESMGIELIRFDMSEYTEQFTVSRLIGAPPGYVGYDRGGLLTEAVSRSPYAVLLLDEIEKAHPQIFNVLLQVMDYGRLTDTNGKKVDFKNVILLMTTNAGASAFEKRSIGFGQTADGEVGSEEIKKIFSPEFRNRLDGIVRFKPLNKENVAKVVEKFLNEVELQLEAKGIRAVFTKGLKKYLGEKGYDERLGARPMAALIQKVVKKKLAEEILFGRLRNGGNVTVDIDEKDNLIIEPELKD